MTALPRPLKATGKRGARWAQWQKHQRALVMSRCQRENRGLCEAPGCQAPATDAHHTAMSRDALSEPLASHNTMQAALCRSHHNAMTRGLSQPLADFLLANAVDNAIEELLPRNARIRLRAHLVEYQPRDAARELERILKADTEAWQALLEEAGVA